MNELKELVEKIYKYTVTWSITETELYWNINSVRKSNYIENKTITDEEFQTAFREEILYDLIYDKGAGLRRQMEEDLISYEGLEDTFEKESIELEEEVRKYITDFKVERVDNNVERQELSEDDYYYAVFVLSRDLITEFIPYETDTAYDFCKRVVDDFNKSDYNNNAKGLYECLEDYVRYNFVSQDGAVTWKGEVIKHD